MIDNSNMLAVNAKLYHEIKQHSIAAGSTTAARLFLDEARANPEMLATALEAVLDVCDAHLFHEGTTAEAKTTSGSWVDISDVIRESLAEQLDTADVGRS